MELGEIDRALMSVPGVGAAAAAKHTTAAGSDVIVGYLVPDENSGGTTGSEIDLHTARAHLRTVLPGGIAPTLCVLDELPMKTSGKVDRRALPWPLPDAGAGTEDLPEELRHLAELWTDQLGPVPLAQDADFFDLGGSSVAVAKLAAALRAEHPAVDIGALYDNPSLDAMAAYLATLHEVTEQRPLPRRIPRWSGIVQFLVVCGIYVVNAARYVIGSIFVVWALAFFFDAGWVPYPPLWPLLTGWLVLFSTPGRIVQAALTARILTAGIRPGTYLRGGWIHLRIWAAERFLTYLKLEPVLGTPFTPTLFRLFGCRIGARAYLHTMPPVTGLLQTGDGVSVEHEVDLAGHWIDGDTLHVGGIVLGDDVRIGVRTFVGPGVTVGAGTEILAGACVTASDMETDGEAAAETGTTSTGRLLGGSPLTDWGEAGLTWPESTPSEASARGAVRTAGPLRLHMLFGLGMVWMNLLPLLAVLPGLFLVLPHVIHHEKYEEVFPVFAAWTPVFAVLTVITWLTCVIITVRILSVFIRPGYFPAESTTGWALWMTHVLMQRTLTSTYFVYAGWLTPAFLRLLGARVGKDTEISTVETIPHLTSIGDRCFLADHSMCTASRHHRSWVHVGTTVLGDGAFVGNSGIVGPDHDLPAQSLVAVLASTPYHPELGSSWLGRSGRAIPRVHVEGDVSRTFNPSERLKAARAVVEFFRLAPAVASAYLDLFIVWAGTKVYMNTYLHGGGGWNGVWMVCLWAWPIVMAAGIVASLLPVLAKWLIVGRFTAGQRTLFSTFVWRSELVDNIGELLAVPSLIRMSLGSPLYNWWARLMGTRIGRDVWCETWWLPEFDLITLADRTTVNRGTVLQTHLFHDRVMSLEPVSMNSGSTLGPSSFLLPGASLGARTTVLPGSLVLRGDSIPSDSVWAGNPVAHVDRPDPTDHTDHSDHDQEVLS